MSKMQLITKGFVKDNPTFVLILGMCPTLATTTAFPRLRTRPRGEPHTRAVRQRWSFWESGSLLPLGHCEWCVAPSA